MTGVWLLGDSARHNDFPSAAVGANGDVWRAGSPPAIGMPRSRFPGVEGDVWMPQVAIDAKGRPWFVWSQQTGYPGGDSEHTNWDLYAT